MDEKEKVYNAIKNVELMEKSTLWKKYKKIV